MNTKIVYKYATGQEIPAGAKYLCTQVETREVIQNNPQLEGFKVSVKNNMLVWHYYEVELGE